MKDTSAYMYLRNHVSIVPTLPVSINSTSPVTETSPLTLVCTVSLDTSIVDSPVDIQKQWTGPNGVVLANTTDITVSVEAFTTTIMFRAVQLTDNGTYLCNVSVLPINNTNIVAFRSTASAFINVTGKNRIIMCTGIFLTNCSKKIIGVIILLNKSIGP